MKPVYSYNTDLHALELVQDGYVLGWMRRTPDLHHSHWLATPDFTAWKRFNDRQSAREWLQSL